MTRTDVVRLVRFYALWAMVGVFFIAAAFATLIEAQNVDDLRASCERANVARTSELRQRQNLIENARARAADPATRAEGLIALARAHQRKRELIASQAEVAVTPGSVVADCRKAYPKPWPISLID